MRSRISVLVLLAGCLAAAPAGAQPTPAPPAPRAAPHALSFGFLLRTGPPPVVIEVMPGSPVEIAGIRAGDTLISVDRQSATIERVQSAARRATPGDTVRFRVRRGDGEREIRVVPQARRFARAPRPPHPRQRERIVVIDPDSIRALTRLYLDGAREALRLHGDLDLDLDLDLDMDDHGGGPRVYRFHFDSLGESIREQLHAIKPQLRELGELRFDMPEVELDFQGFAVLPGARLTDLNDDLARYFPGATDGVLVLSVRSDSRAGGAGLRAGDVIVAFDGEAIHGLGDLRRASRDRDQVHTLTVVRGGERLTLRLEPR